MTQLQKYTWLIETIRRAGKISHKELSGRWERDKNLSDCRPLSRATFNRWRDAIDDYFGIRIACQRAGGYNYYISNPGQIDGNRLRKWMLDSFALGNVIGENMALQDRIIVDSIPSGRDHLTTILDAMKENRVIKLAYKAFGKPEAKEFAVEPYCVKFFENRWYLLGHNISRNTMRLYALDRMESVGLSDTRFSMPEDFSAAEFFSDYFGIVVDSNPQPATIVLRANGEHKHYLNSLPLHHSQRLIKDTGDYADFELNLVPTYDFIMKLLQGGAMVEVVSPPSLRATMKRWIGDMQRLYD